MIDSDVESFSDLRKEGIKQKHVVCSFKASQEQYQQAERAYTHTRIRTLRMFLESSWRILWQLHHFILLRNGNKKGGHITLLIYFHSNNPSTFAFASQTLSQSFLIYTMSICLLRSEWANASVMTEESMLNFLLAANVAHVCLAA